MVALHLSLGDVVTLSAECKTCRKLLSVTVGLGLWITGWLLHICAGGKGGYLVEQNAAKFGKVNTGRSCINFKKLEDLKLDAAMAFVKQAAK